MLFGRKKKLSMPWKKYYSDSDLNIKVPDINMYDQIKKSSLINPNGIAYEYFSTKVKYKNFVKKIDRAAIAFKRLGIKKGDVITICMPNTPEALISLYALNKLGAVCNMLLPLSATEEIKFSLTSTNSKMLIVIDMLYSKVKEIINQTRVKKVIFVSACDSMHFPLKIGYKFINAGKYEKWHRTEKYMSWNDLMFKSLTFERYKLKKYGKDTPAVILHSGGTSGKPKNVVLQNSPFVLLSKQGRIILNQVEQCDSCLAVLPNFHGFGLGVSMHIMFALGIKVILVPQFDSKKFDTLLKQKKPSIIFGVPTLFEALINSNNERDLDLSFLKLAISGGDSLSKNLEDKVNEFLSNHGAKCNITQGYGLSEALAAVCLGIGKINKSGSIGIPLPGNYIKIIDTATRENLPFNEVGEICIHTEALMMGYLDNEVETNQALQVHKDGYVWLHTGDLGYMDEDGFIFYKARQKRMIISSGFNVYPSHVESVIESHPAVLQCSVVGMPHPYKKEVPKAFIVLREGFHGLFIKNEIKEYCQKNLEHHMVPYKFVYRKKLPKTKLGKVDFRQLQSDNGEDDDE